METFEAINRDEWRSWLINNHSSVKEIWLVYYKKHTKKPSITYKESVEEAICFGWIDGIKKRIDEERYVHRFTPRRKNSKWSAVNIDIAKRMIKTKMMKSEGLKAFNKYKKYNTSTSEIPQKLYHELEQKFRENKIAFDNFNKLAKSHQRQYILWINSAKKDETKQKRLLESILLLEQNIKLGMK